MAALADEIVRVGELLSGLESPTVRLGVTVGAIVVAVGVAFVALPWIRRRVAQAVATRRSTGTDRVDRTVPRWLGELLVRLLQGAVLAGTGLAILVVWGLSGPAARLLGMENGSASTAVSAGGTLLVGILAYVTANQYERTVARIGSKATWLTDHQQEIVTRLGQLAIFLLGGLIALSVWGVNLQGLLVGAGFLGIVVGLAARQTLGSLIAGFVLMFSRPFTIGDWVEIGEEEGVVTDITIVNTRLENFDGEVVVIPNDRVSNRPIVNRSERGVLRLRVEVGIDYTADPERAKSVALAAIKDIDVVADAPPPQIIPKAFGDSAILLEMRFWIDHPTPPRKWTAVERVVTSVKQAFDDAGIKIPFPQRELSGQVGPGGIRGPDSEREPARPEGSSISDGSG